MTVLLQDIKHDMSPKTRVCFSVGFKKNSFQSLGCTSMSNGHKNSYYIRELTEKNTFSLVCSLCNTYILALKAKF